MRLTAGQKAIVNSIKSLGPMYVSERQSPVLYRQHMTLVQRGVLEVKSRGEYGCTFQVVAK